MSEWQPIETAPSEGQFLGFWEYVYYGDRDRTCGIEVAERGDYNSSWIMDHEGAHQPGIYTHWMPLPEPPK
jgi:hypothetical protein